MFVALFFLSHFNIGPIWISSNLILMANNYQTQWRICTTSTLFNVFLGCCSRFVCKHSQKKLIFVIKISVGMNNWLNTIFAPNTIGFCFLVFFLLLFGITWLCVCIFATFLIRWWCVNILWPLNCVAVRVAYWNCFLYSRVSRTFLLCFVNWVNKVVIIAEQHVYLFQIKSFLNAIPNDKIFIIQHDSRKFVEFDKV